MISDKHRKIVHYYIINGFNQQDACVRAGLSKNSTRDIFTREDVREEIALRLKESEKKTDMDRDWLLNKLQEIIEASPGDMLEIDEKGRPSLNWNLLSPSLRKSIRKITIDQSREGGKYKRTHTHVSIDPYDKIAAIKEAATLLGIRETKTKIDIEQSLIDALTSRRDELAGEDNGDS